MHNEVLIRQLYHNPYPSLDVPDFTSDDPFAFLVRYYGYMSYNKSFM